VGRLGGANARARTSPNFLANIFNERACLVEKQDTGIARLCTTWGGTKWGGGKKPNAVGSGGGTRRDCNEIGVTKGEDETLSVWSAFTNSQAGVEG